MVIGCGIDVRQGVRSDGWGGGWLDHVPQAAYVVEWHQFVPGCWLFPGVGGVKGGEAAAPRFTLDVPNAWKRPVPKSGKQAGEGVSEIQLDTSPVLRFAHALSSLLLVDALSDLSARAVALADHLLKGYDYSLPCAVSV